MTVALHLHRLWGFKIDWGNVPSWFGSVLTGASLMLGFYILLRDRSKEEREQASKVMAQHYDLWPPDHYLPPTTLERLDGKPIWRVVVTNKSDGPLSGVVVMACLRADLLVQELKKSGAHDEARSIPRMHQFEVYHLERDGRPTAIIEAGDRLYTDFVLPRDLRYYDLRVEFLDANAVRWVRHLGSGHLHRWSKAHRPRASELE
jgi:hypothetical protein